MHGDVSGEMQGILCDLNLQFWIYGTLLESNVAIVYCYAGVGVALFWCRCWCRSCQCRMQHYRLQLILCEFCKFAMVDVAEYVRWLRSGKHVSDQCYDQWSGFTEGWTWTLILKRFDTTSIFDFPVAHAHTWKSALQVLQTWRSQLSSHITALSFKLDRSHKECMAIGYAAFICIYLPYATSCAISGGASSFIRREQKWLYAVL